MPLAGGLRSVAGLPQQLNSAVYDAASRLQQWGSTVLTYDDNGNLTSDGTNTFTWDARNRLASMTGASFQYDPFGRRTSKSIADAATRFLYDGINVVQEISATTANLLGGLGIDEIFIRTDPAGVRHFLTDALGSTLALVDAPGSVQTSYSYEPFGATTASGSPSTNSFHFTGREEDGTGLYYYRARYYQPNLARFMSEDPLDFYGGVNLYAYVNDSPVTYIDPLGLRCAYSQATGRYSCIDDTTGQTYVRGRGWAGQGRGLNAPSMQNVPFIGPLPRGCYRVAAIDNSITTFTLVLSPTFAEDSSNDRRDLNFFRVHGPRRLNPERSSQGCAIMPGRSSSDSCWGSDMRNGIAHFFGFRTSVAAGVVTLVQIWSGIAAGKQARVPPRSDFPNGAYNSIPKNAHLTLSGVRIGTDTLRDVLRVFGQANVAVGDGGDPSRVCYVSADSEDDTVVEFESGGAGPDETIIGARAYARGHAHMHKARDSCRASKLVSRNIRTRSGLGLGLAVDEVKGALGEPIKQSSTQLKYEYLAEVKLSRSERSTLALRFPTGKVPRIAEVITEIEFQFSSGRVIELRLRQTTGF